MPVPTPMKQAVLVGVQSKHGKNTVGGVPGAHQDVKKLRELLINHYQFRREHIAVLMDSDKLPSTDHRWPTRDNIVKAMKNLVQGKQAGDHIVFSFSGHGEQTVATQDKNERDGLDELLVPVDCEKAKNACGYSHFIRDDEIRKIFVDQLEEGVHCTLIFDCCHSGTACDLPEVGADSDSDLDSDSDDDGGALATKSSAPGFTKEETLHHRHAARNIASDPNTVLISVKDVTSWSACADAQMTYGGFKQGGRFTGAFIDIIQEAATNGKAITHRELLLDLRARLEKVTREFNEGGRDTSARPNEGDLPAPRPQLGSLVPEHILDQMFSF